MSAKHKIRHRYLRRSGRSESDGQSLLKLIVLVILGSVWVRWHSGLTISGIVPPPLPVGMIIGIMMVHRFEHFRTDRKVWFAVLVFAALISFFLPSGVMI